MEGPAPGEAAAYAPPVDYGNQQHAQHVETPAEVHQTSGIGHPAPAAEGDHAEGDKPSVGTAEAILDAGRIRAMQLAAQFSAAAGDAGNKRKLEDDGAEGPDSKRVAGESLPNMYSSDGPPGVALGAALLSGDAGGSATEVVMCPSDKVGRIIGRAGATIRDLETNNGTRIQVDHKAPGDKPVTISGPRDAVERCKRTIQDLISGSGNEADAQRNIECPPGIVGRVIGRGGETIRSLQQASGAHILVNQDFPEGVPRQITITGSQDAVERAASMVHELINGDHANTQQVIQRFGVGSTEVIEVPKPMVGRIIGKGGETIKDLQKRYNCSIQIDQGPTPCKVTITGPTHQIGSARRAIEDLIRSTQMPPHMGGGPHRGPPSYNAPYSSPYPAPGGPGGPPYGGYGGYPAPAPGYGAPGGYPPYGGYGGYPPASYGGYGGGYGAPSDPYSQSSGYGQSYGAGGQQQPQSYGAGGQQQQQQQQQQPASSGQQSGSSVWQALQDDQGRTYYYNSQTGVSQWEKPAEMP